jgi:4-amino-4-deoxy-L-arabinose transferase-like glycosyltransferase
MGHNDNAITQAGTKAPRPVRRSAQVVLCTIALALLVAAAVPTLFYPFTRDQGAYAYIADLMMHGGVPYRDAWDLKPPGVYWVYQAAFRLFGRSEFAIRLFETLYTLLSAATVYALADAVFKDRAVAALSAWVYAFAYFLLLHHYSVANPEAFLVPLVMACFYGMVRYLRSRNELWLFAGGIAGGVALWFKPTAGLTVAAAFLWAAAVTWRSENSVARLARTLGIATLGGLLGLAPAVLLLYSRGLAELLELWTRYGSGAYLTAGGLALGDGPLAMLDVIVGYVREWQLLVWLTLTGLAILVVPGRNTHAKHPEAMRYGTAIVAFLLSTLLAVLLQGKLFEYHWVPALAPASILSALSLMMLVRGARETLGTSGLGRWERHSTYAILFAAIVIGGLLLLTAYDHTARYRRLVAYLSGRVSEDQYYSQFDIGSDFSRTGTLRTATYLRDHTTPSDTIFIWGAEPLVNFLAQRRSPTRYIFSYMLIEHSQGADVEARRQDLLEELREREPAYVVLVEGDITPLSPMGSQAQLDQFPALRTMLETEYVFEIQIEDYSIYHRAQGSGRFNAPMKEASSISHALISAFHTTHV